MPADDTAAAEALPSTFELQAAIVAAARASGPAVARRRPGPAELARHRAPGRLLPPRRARRGRGGGGQPAPAVGRGAAGRRHRRGASPTPLAGDGTSARAFLAEAIDFGVERARVRARRVGRTSWCAAILGAGYPTPTRMLHHLEQVMERYLVDVTGSDPGPPGRFHVFGTEGGAAAMAYVFRTLQANHIVKPGDAIAITTPIFTPYLQIPVLESFGFRVVELRAAHNAPYRFDDAFLEQLLDPTIKVVLRRQPRQPRQPGDPPGEADPAARPRARQAPGPRDRRRHRLRHVRRGLPQHAGRPPAPRHLPALVLQELRRDRQPARLRRRARRHHPRRAARRPAARRRARRRPTATDR